MMVHEIKSEQPYYDLVREGIKKFEVRFNDRNYEVGDVLHLQEFVNGKFTSNWIEVGPIQYIFRGGDFGIENSYIVMNW